MPNRGMCARTEAAQQPLLREAFGRIGTVAGVICPPSRSLSPMSVPLFPMGLDLAVRPPVTVATDVDLRFVTRTCLAGVGRV